MNASYYKNSLSTKLGIHLSLKTSNRYMIKSTNSRFAKNKEGYEYAIILETPTRIHDKNRLQI
jgi:hypothetical protein